MAANPYSKSVVGGTPSKKEKKSKPVSTTPSTTASANVNTKSKKVSVVKPVDTVLRAEILALGGDEDDIKMLEELDSESELEDEPVEKSSKKGKKVETVDVRTCLLKELSFH